MRPIRGVLFDMGDTLLGRGDGPAILRDEAKTLGANVDDDDRGPHLARDPGPGAHAPEEIAKGRDLSEQRAP